MQKNISVILSLIIFFLYGLFLGDASHIASIAYAFIVCASSLVVFLIIDPKKIKTVDLVFILLVVHFSFYIGALAAGIDQSILWGEDSHLYHIPASINYKIDLTNFFTNKEYFNGRVLPIHIVTGILFDLIGVNTLASTLSMLLFKIPIIVLVIKLGEGLFERSVGIKAALLYIYLPSTFMYSAVFFKEVSVQLYIVVFYYFFHHYIIRKEILYFLISLLALLLIGYERIYIFPGIVAGIGSWFSYELYKRNVERKTLIFLCFILVSGFMFTVYFIPILKIENVFQYVNEQRDVYLGLKGVTEWNRIIPFPLTFFKILLAPFFTPNKLETFKGILFLILWSAPFVNLMMCGMFFEMLKSAIRMPRFHLAILVAVTSYLLLLAYVRPYDARVRDSFTPLFVIYFCALLLNLNWVNKIKNSVSIFSTKSLKDS